MSDAAPRAARHEYDGYDALLEDYYARGWTDGLPVVPPTPEKVAAFLDFAQARPEEVLGTINTRDVTVYAEQAAINAVMAGCRREYMPVVLAAVRTMLEVDSNPHTVTATLAGAIQTIVINGPLRKALDINCGLGCMGPGYRANSTIGRALRLTIRNVFKAVPGQLDRAALSSPLRYSFCFGENEEESPWIPLHVERGFKPEDSTVTIYSCQFPMEIFQSATSPEAVLAPIAAGIIREGLPWNPLLGVGGRGEFMIVIAKEHMNCLAKAGMAKADVKAWLWDKLVTTPEQDRKALRVRDPEGIVLVAAGGAAHTVSMYLRPHCSVVVTRKIDYPR
ncbi:MAG: hypothetical protein AB7Q97_24930 [Gammaproteobacteria bacterium]